MKFISNKIFLPEPVDPIVGEKLEIITEQMKKTLYKFYLLLIMNSMKVR